MRVPGITPPLESRFEDGGLGRFRQCRDSARCPPLPRLVKAAMRSQDCWHRRQVSAHRCIGSSFPPIRSHASAHAANRRTNTAGEVVPLRSLQHDVRAGLTDLGATQKQPDVGRIGVPSSGPLSPSRWHQVYRTASLIFASISGVTSAGRAGSSVPPRRPLCAMSSMSSFISAISRT